MENKVLIKLVVPEIEKNFDLFIPVNEVIWKTKKMIVKCVSDLTNNLIDLQDEYLLINSESGRIYKNNEIVIDTDIRNATTLLLITRSV